MNTLKKISLATLFGAAFALAPAISQASTRFLGEAVTPVPKVATFELTSDHCSIPGTDTPGGCGLAGGTQSEFGTITVTDNGLGSLSFHIALDHGNMFVHTGFDADIGFNLAGISSILFTSITGGWSIPGGASPSQTSDSLHMDGTGFFDFGVVCTICGSGASNPFAGPVDFTITAAGLDITDLAKNGSGQFFAVDIISGTTRATGAVDASNGTGCGPACGDVPEPASLALLGIGLFALYGVGRRRQR